MKKIKLGEGRYATIEEIFDYKGFKCIIILNEIKLPPKIISLEGKWRCGYCGVKKGHPIYKKDYDKVGEFIFAHGGLTFSNFGDGKFLPKNKTWWIGFDCNHYTDKIKNWTFARVKKEVKELAEQLTIKNMILKNLK